MKKYIRTKNGIFETRSWEKHEFIVSKAVAVYPNSLFPTQRAIKESEIIAEADTIEELCDFVFVKYNDNSRSDIVDLHIAGDLGLLFSQLKKELSFVDYIKLTIETDKGLIYVAKMNDKGELELL